MKRKLKPNPETPEFFGFYCKIRDPREVQLLREVSADLGHPNNAALIHLLAQHYFQNNLEVRS